MVWDGFSFIYGKYWVDYMIVRQLRKWEWRSSVTLFSTYVSLYSLLLGFWVFIAVSTVMGEWVCGVLCTRGKVLFFAVLLVF